MKLGWLMASVVTGGLLATVAAAQDTPPPHQGIRVEAQDAQAQPRGDVPRPRPDAANADRPRPDAANADRPRVEGDRPRPDGPPGRRPGPDGAVPRPPGMEQIDQMRAYLDVVDRYARLARDPAASGVAAVVTAADVLRPRGPEAAIEYFNKLLPSVKNEAVQRALRLQLIDLYKASNQQEKALEQLQTLITAAPAAAEGWPMMPGGWGAPGGAPNPPTGGF